MLLDRYISDGVSFLDDATREITKKELIEKYHSKIRAKGANIIVEPYITPKKSTGGIIMAESFREEDQFHSTICRVIDIGPLAYTSDKYTGKASWCDIGDWVIVPRSSGSRIPLNNDDINCLRIVLETDIIAIVNEPTDFKIKVINTKY